LDWGIVSIKQEQITLKKNDTIPEYQREIEYLSSRLDDATKDLAKLDLHNLSLTRQKKQAIATFNFIKIMQEKIEEAFTVNDLYVSIVKALTSELSMDSSMLIKINYKTKKIILLASKGLSKNVRVLKLDNKISKKELLNPTFVNSKSSLKPFHLWIRKAFKFPYFVWYPIIDEGGGILVLFIGNSFEDMVLKHPFSEASLELLGAISSVILLRRDNIAKTQEMLRRKEERIDFLAEILKNSTISVIATDKDRKIIYVNAATEKLFGYKAEELIGKNPCLLIAEPNVPDIQKAILDTIMQEKVWMGEMLNKKKNGDLFYIHATISQLLDKEENFIAMVGFQRDITEYKRAEEELRVSEERFRSLFETAPEFINILDRNAVILQINPAVILRSGYTEEEMFDRRITEFLTPASQKIFEKEFSILMEKGNHRVEVEFVCKNGTIINADCSCMVVRDEQGEFTNIVTFLRDITERRKAEDKLKLTQKELEIKAKNLEETNTALKVLLKHQDEEKNIMERNILTNLKTLVFPYLEKIKISASDERQKTYLNIIETNLSEITKPFANQLTESYSKLTPTEIQITSLIRENKTAKDIAGILDVSETTVFFHRRNIRKKLGLKSKKTNLRSYLQYVPSD